MSKNDWDFIEEDFDLGFKFPDTIIKPNKYFHKKPVICFQLIDCDQTDYNFTQNCFDNKDVIALFKIFKEISNVTISELIDNSEKELHFHLFNNLPPNVLLNLMKKILGIPYFHDEQIPLIGQIALYTDTNRANRESGIKSPRIYFIVGAYAVFHLLFYDPYHEICPDIRK